LASPSHEFAPPSTAETQAGGSSADGGPALGGPLVRCERLNKIYDDGNVAAVVDLSVTIRRGEYVAIMGPSGCGKSTLLNLIGTLDRPTSGEIYFEEQPLSRMPDVDGLRIDKIGFVFQAFHLLPTLSAIENVLMPMFEGPLPFKRRLERATELLDAVGMGHRKSHLPTKLSAGERQRVAIARALANDPQMLLADEPTGNLDSHNGEEILALFDRMHVDNRKTLVVVTHSQEVADRSQRLIRMRDGRIIQDNPSRPRPGIDLPR
jgi:putative ABC transport system ATP-binding protein